MKQLADFVPWFFSAGHTFDICTDPPLRVFRFFMSLVLMFFFSTGASAVGALNVKIVLGEEEK